MEIKKDDLTGKEIIGLLQRHAIEMETNSPPGSCHYLDLDGLRAPEITFWSIRDGDRLAGCGALKELDERHGEIKSMHVHSDFRGKGIGDIMLKFVLGVAQERGYRRLSLETGAMDAFLPARRLYEKHGFSTCSSFGDYGDDPNSLFMTRVL
ncbi:MAG TPA: GNAT family N-acetyltransferase [Rhizobiales bacterium]|nr:GNAT family N-acetyltransferase [Hyphomicrobiales bacterium]